MSVYASDSERNHRFLPEQYFDGERLDMGKAIYPHDKLRIEQLLKQGKDVNALTNNHGVSPI